jgi:hypothetical protein
MDKAAQMLGWPGAGRHSGRMTQKDFDFLEPLMKIQPCINSFKVWDGRKVDYEFEQTCFHHNPPGWPRSFTRQYASAVGIDPSRADKNILRQLDIDPFLFVDKKYKIDHKPIMICRNKWYLDGIPDAGNVDAWNIWISSGLAEQAFYCGLPEEHKWFEDTMKMKIQYIPTSDSLELARYMSGAEMVIANQSMGGTMAVSMGKTCWIETRKNVELENNEIYYPYKINAHYF